MVGLEAMRCGTLTLISDASEGPLSYAKDGINTTLFSGNNPQNLAEKLAEIQGWSEEAKEQMRQQAILTGKEYGSVRMGKKLERIFAEIEGQYKEQ